MSPSREDSLQPELKPTRNHPCTVAVVVVASDHLFSIERIDLGSYESIFFHTSLKVLEIKFFNACFPLKFRLSLLGVSISINCKVRGKLFLSGRGEFVKLFFSSSVIIFRYYRSNIIYILIYFPRKKTRIKEKYD